MAREEQAMTSERLRQAIDDSVLTHTGRSIGELASQRVIDDIWPLIEAREAALVAVVERVAVVDIAERIIPRTVIRQARALLASAGEAEAGKQGEA